MTTLKKPSQCRRLLAWLILNPAGITTMESFGIHKITNLHKRIGELEDDGHEIVRTPEVINGARVIRYSLAK